ncbi:MAG TPA: hypothetical protein VD978_20375 [Azospirillum sp.]|nr:hypothetical protein [Azospirillum sp.]
MLRLIACVLFAVVVNACTPGDFVYLGVDAVNTFAIQPASKTSPARPVTTPRGITSTAAQPFTTTPQPETQNALEVATILRYVPAVLDFCQNYDPAAEKAYVRLRDRYLTDTATLQEAAYRVGTRSGSFSRSDLEQGTQKMNRDRVAAEFRSIPAMHWVKACRETIEFCRRQESFCSPPGSLYPDKVGNLTKAADRS